MQEREKRQGRSHDVGKDFLKLKNH